MKQRSKLTIFFLIYCSELLRFRHLLAVEQQTAWLTLKNKPKGVKTSRHLRFLSCNKQLLQCHNSLLNKIGKCSEKIQIQVKKVLARKSACTIKLSSCHTWLIVTNACRRQKMNAPTTKPISNHPTFAPSPVSPCTPANIVHFSSTNFTATVSEY
jgi:hypothetical protein